MKKQIIGLLALIFMLCISLSMRAQNNTFPTSGNVGIGTTSPSYKLDVRAVAPTKGAYFQTSGLWQAIDFSSDGGITKGSLSASGSKLFIGVASSGTNPIQAIDLSTGRVGIGTGTTTPTSLLTVNMSGTGAQSPSFELQSNNTTGLKLSNSNSFQDAWIDHNYSSANNIIFALRGTEKMRLTNSGNVGIGTTAPVAKLQVTNGSVLFDGTTGTTPVSGAGTRMMWIPAKAAFRAGTVYSGMVSWDDVNIGLYSTAFGNSSVASGESSFAAGVFARAAGVSSAAFGSLTQANGICSASFGSNSIASGSDAVAFGNTSTASAPRAASFGTGTLASGGSSTSFGEYTNATGNVSTSFGVQTVSQSFCSFVIGQWNYNPGTYDRVNWVATNPLFVIGNGTSSTATSNAVTVLKNGNFGIGKTAPAYPLDVNGTVNATQFLISGSPMYWSVVGNNLVYDLNNTNNSSVGIGVANASSFNCSNTAICPNGKYKLAVNGAIRAKAVMVEPTWSDFVFEKDYRLPTLEEVESFIKDNKHLPEIPSAKEVEKGGIEVGQMNALLLQKIEELTLYMIEMKKENQMLKKDIELLKKQ